MRRAELTITRVAIGAARSLRVAAAVVLTGGMFAACGILPGDKGLPIAFVNRTGESIVLYEKGRANPAVGRS